MDAKQILDKRIGWPYVLALSIGITGAFLFWCWLAGNLVITDWLVMCAAALFVLLLTLLGKVEKDWKK